MKHLKFLAIPLFLLFFTFDYQQYQFFAAEKYIVEAESLDSYQAAIVLGAKVDDQDPSDILEDRLLTAIELYEKGKVEKILVSGDNGQVEYNEVGTMKNYLLNEGVPAEDIFMDHAGFDTYDSMYRAAAIFQVENAVIVTQNYHLPRAIYIARALGIDAVGVSADRQTYVYIDLYEKREKLAQIKAFLNVVFHSKPKYLGESIPINGNGQESWN